MDLDAGTASVTLTLNEGALNDSDAASDIVAGVATVVLLDANDSGDAVGTLLDPIGTSVDDLSVNTSSGTNNGSQYIREKHGISEIHLQAATGKVTD